MSRRNFGRNRGGIGIIGNALIGASLMILVPETVQSAKAGVIGDVWGIATDPIKLGKGSQNILDAVDRLQPLIDQLKGIEGQTNADLTERIHQVQLIVNSVVSAVNNNVPNLVEIVKEAEKTIAALEQRIFLDASTLMFQLTSSWPPSVGRSQNAAPLPAGLFLQSEPHNEPERIAPRPSSPGPCRSRQRHTCCRIFTGTSSRPNKT